MKVADVKTLTTDRLRRALTSEPMVNWRLTYAITAEMAELFGRWSNAPARNGAEAWGKLYVHHGDSPPRYLKEVDLIIVGESWIRNQHPALWGALMAEAIKPQFKENT